MTDVGLSEEGRVEAEHLAQDLEGMSFDAIFVSNMKRAKETALLIASKTKKNISPVIFPELNERYFGHLEGLPSTLMYAFEEAENQSLLDHRAYKQLEIETPKQIQKRALGAVDKILKTSKNQLVLVVSHGRFFNELCKVLGTPTIQQIQHNSLIRFTLYQDNNWAWEKVEQKVI